MIAGGIAMLVGSVCATIALHSPSGLPVWFYGTIGAVGLLSGWAMMAVAVAT